MHRQRHKRALGYVCRLLFFAFPAVGITLSGNVRAETIAEFDTTRFLIIDSLTAAGEIARPQFCPADSTWIAYEIHDERTIKLFIHNWISGEKRRIDPLYAVGEDSLVDSLSSRMNYDLAWRPLLFEDNPWAAYVSDSSGIQDIYLYNVRSGRSYCLLCPDSDSGTKTPLIRGAPVWSPDGRCLAYAAGLNDDADIYLIRGMDRIIERAAQTMAPVSPSELIDDEGSQFGAAWCPVPGSGYLAYTDQEKPGARLRIKIRDILSGKTFQLSHTDSIVDYFAPSWNAGGTRLAYYLYGGDGGPITRFSGPEDGGLGLGLSAVYTLGDSLVIAPRSGGSPAGEEILEVATNYDRLLGPAWLPGGRHLVVDTHEEPKPSRLWVISIDDWEAGETDYDYWLRGFGGDRFDFPRDLNILNRNISFIYRKDARKFLLTGQIIPSIKLVIIADSIEIPDSRRGWWTDFAGSEPAGPGLLARLGKFLWSPIAGPDLGINKGFVPVIGGVALLVFMISDKDNPGPSPSVRDWTPPDFPETGKAQPGFRITLRL